MRTNGRGSIWAGLAMLVSVLVPGAAAAQDASQLEVTPERLAAYTKTYAEISQLRDEMQAKLAASPNKTIEAQQQLRETLKQRSGEIIKANGLTAEQYARITWLISVDDELRKTFDEALARIIAEKGGGEGDRID